LARHPFQAVSVSGYYGILFWTTADIETKLLDFQHYYNDHRTHAGLDGLQEPTAEGSVTPIALDSYQ
jgi:hypothetical protein